MNYLAIRALTIIALGILSWVIAILTFLSALYLFS